MNRFQIDALYSVMPVRGGGFVLGVRIKDMTDGRRRMYLKRMQRNRTYRSMSMRNKVRMRRMLLNKRVAD